MMGRVDTFGRHFQQLLKRRKLTQLAFSKQTKTNKSLINNIIGGHRTPSPDLLDTWADGLGLIGPERQLFLDLAALAHLPLRFRPRFEALIADRDAAGSPPPAGTGYPYTREVAEAAYRRGLAEAQERQKAARPARPRKKHA